MRDPVRPSDLEDLAVVKPDVDRDPEKQAWNRIIHPASIAEATPRLRRPCSLSSTHSAGCRPLMWGAAH